MLQENITMAKKQTVKKIGKKKTEMKKGSKYTCSVCGLVVSIDNECGCASVCDLMCCHTPMKPKKSKG
jgi:hypothetical protein